MADPGLCPICGKKLIYGTLYTMAKESPSKEIYYSVECSGKRCAFQGKEVYALEYVTTGELK